MILFACVLAGYFGKHDQMKWMDRGYTVALKGFAMFTIVWAHSAARMGIGGVQFIAGVGVALFLICSGFGLELSYEKNGLNHFWIKRLVNVFFPFWIAELAGLISTGEFTFRKYLLDLTFIKPATSYGWFMGYIFFCYVLFFVSKLFFDKKQSQQSFLIISFLIWFVIDSLYFVNPAMPFLKARQMLSFPFGVIVADNLNFLKSKITKVKAFAAFFTGGGILILFMGITQLPYVKNLPYIISNCLALLTCFPGAVGVVALGYYKIRIFNNRMLKLIGGISYEFYLVHAFTLEIVHDSLESAMIFLLVTLLLGYVFHLMNEGLKNGRFNNYYSYKK